MLTVLAVAAAQGRSLGSDELVEAVYGDNPPPRVRRSLSTELWRCRQLLGPEAIQGDDHGYRIDQRRVDIDLVQFTRGLEAGRASIEAEDFAAAERHLTATLALWRGAPLSEWDDHAVGRASVARLEEFRLGGTEDLAEALAGLGRHAEAIALLTPVTREHPAREHAWALMIESHLAAGDRRRACTALDSVRRTLAEHGVDLGAELRGVRGRLQASGAIEEAVRVAPRPTKDDLLGRAASVRLVVAAIDSALNSGKPGAAVISGEAGIGKTALAERAVASLGPRDPEPSIWRVTCDERLTLPFATIRPVLRRHATDAGVDLPPWMREAAELPTGADLAALVADLTGVVERCAIELGGVVLLVDDAQWASRELLEMLLSIMSRQSGAPIAIVVTIRSSDVMTTDPHASAHAGLLRELRRRAGCHVALTGLTPLHVREFFGAGVNEADAIRVHELTGGNPLYLHQLSLEPGGGVVRSASLADALDHRIDALPLDVLKVVEVAAAIGTHFDARVLASAVAHPPFAIAPDAVFDALEMARRAGLLTTSTTEQYNVGFVHALVRDRLYERSPYRQRTSAHALIATALTRLAGPDAPTADLIADHSRKAWPVCPTADVVGRLEAAGESANGQLAFEEACRYFQMALDLIAMDPTFDDEYRMEDLLAAIGQAAAAAGNLAQARSSYEKLRKHGLSRDRPLASLRGALGTMWTYAHDRIDAHAIDHLEEAIDNALASEPSSDPAEPPLLRDALTALHVYRPDAERERRPSAITRGPQFRTPILGALWEQETVPQARVIADDLMTAPDGDPLSARIRRWVSGVASGTSALTDEPPGIWATPGSRQAQWEATVWKITTAMSCGDFQRALRLIDEAEQHVGQVRHAVDSAARHAQLLGQRMWVALQTGDTEARLATARANKPQYTTRRPIMRAAGALIQLMAGDPAAALATCDALVDEFSAGVIPSRDVHASIVSLSDACLWLHHERGIAVCRELLTPFAGEHVLFYVVQYWGSVNHHLGKLAVQQGDLDAGVDHLIQAIDEHERAGARVFSARSRSVLAAAQWFRDRPGDRAAAATHHTLAAGEARAMGLADIVEPWPPTEPLLWSPGGPRAAD